MPPQLLPTVPSVTLPSGLVDTNRDYTEPDPSDLPSVMRRLLTAIAIAHGGEMLIPQEAWDAAAPYEPVFFHRQVSGGYMLRVEPPEEFEATCGPMPPGVDDVNGEAEPEPNLVWNTISRTQTLYQFLLHLANGPCRSAVNGVTCHQRGLNDRRLPLTACPNCTALWFFRQETT